MDLCALFWFYKDFRTCRQRLQRFRERNPGIRVFALYGGPLEHSTEAQSSVLDYVDDFYGYPDERDARWKWMNGDQLIAAWYKDRGSTLQWDTLFIMQWDMLILSPIERMLQGLKKDQMLLSGYTPIEAVASWWPWANSQHSDIDGFTDYIKREFEYDGPLFACLFIVVCMPRVFLQRFVEIGHPEVGFLEYKIPTLARIFEIHVYEDHALNPNWTSHREKRSAGSRQLVLNAVSKEVPVSTILHELAKPAGARLFHPVSKAMPKWLYYISETNLSSRILNGLSSIVLAAERVANKVRTPKR